VKVKLSTRAKRELERIDARWRKHRPLVPNLLIEELVAAEDELAMAPYSRRPCGEFKGQTLRFYLLRKTAYQVYYTVTAEDDVVMIHSIWGARRGRGPKLR
jgi:plasmid stabilization system protein ParE